MNGIAPCERMKSTAGFSQFEFIVCIFIVLFLLMGVVYINLPGGSDWEEGEGPPHIPPYRWANAAYIHNQLESLRVSVLGYKDMYNRMPGDSGRGDHLRIEKGLGENRKFFKDLHDAGYIRREEVLIRGRDLDVYWTVLGVNGNATQGNFFKLPGVNIHEARAVELKYDDGRNYAGNVLYSVKEGAGEADLFVRLELY